jgi:single-stranded DNA-binding protein
VLEKYTHKGSKVLLQGRLTYKKWVNKEGQNVVTAEIVLDRFESQMKLLDSKRDSENELASEEIASSDEQTKEVDEEPIPF